ncbi:cyclin-dependent kinase inhibitor 3-like isoform X2 [Mangifera indica]|uniref:cyclin-dependent kinase inhibitor 3-like isoform X2 n=1 Tax=Mangifera indica TaxID=29780 RepID=UPI001CFACDFA|nr:cyclin-dependent kinase inhibitor 3-like isoform X2 [Mangifera indica]
MGKYMKKSKITGDFAVLELSTGVLTRAKTLALKRLLKLSVIPNPDDASSSSSSFCYLQLRNRRLEKPPPPCKQLQPKDKTCKPQNPSPDHTCDSEPNSSLRLNSVRSGSVGSVPLGRDDRDMQGSFGNNEMMENGALEAGAEEASLGENNLELEPRDRSTRESTPCSMIRRPDIVTTPSSTTRRIRPSYHGAQHDTQRIIPTPRELEEFFAYAEQQQQRYNFDALNDMPLPGRYEWVQVFP